MRKKRFLLDTNVFIAAFKSGYTKTTQLILKLLSDPNVELIANSVLLEEYRSWLTKLSSKLPHIKEHAEILYLLITQKAVLVEPDPEHIERCKPFIPEGEYADLYHAASSLKAGATVITNDKDFNKIGEVGLVKVLTISEAIKELLDPEDLNNPN